VDGTAAAGQENVDVFRQLPQNLCRGMLICVETFGRENNLLLGPGMGEERIVPGVAAIHGTAFPTNAFLSQNLIQVRENTGVDDARPGGHLMLFATDTASAVLPAVYPHNKLPLLVKVYKNFEL
jgi:hypothetical protein